MNPKVQSAEIIANRSAATGFFLNSSNFVYLKKKDEGKVILKYHSDYITIYFPIKSYKNIEDVSFYHETLSFIQHSMPIFQKSMHQLSIL